jgi:hypothetical protein
MFEFQTAVTNQITEAAQVTPIHHESLYRTHKIYVLGQANAKWWHKAFQVSFEEDAAVYLSYGEYHQAHGFYGTGGEATLNNLPVAVVVATAKAMLEEEK